MQKIFFALLVTLLSQIASAQTKKLSFDDIKGVMPAQPYGYSQVVSTPLNGTLLILSGQTAWDSAGNIIGKGDFKRQVEHCLELIERILQAKGSKKSDIVKLTYYVKDLDEAKMYAITEVATKFFTNKNYPAGCLLGVAKLAHEDFLVEVEATAIVIR